MDIKAEKLSIIQQLLKVEDELLLASIQKLLDYSQMKKLSEPQEDFWDELTERQKVQIEIARKQLRAGEGIPHEEVMAEFRKKYGA